MTKNTTELIYCTTYLLLSQQLLDNNSFLVASILNPTEVPVKSGFQFPAKQSLHRSLAQNYKFQCNIASCLVNYACSALLCLCDLIFQVSSHLIFDKLHSTSCHKEEHNAYDIGYVVWLDRKQQEEKKIKLNFFLIFTNRKHVFPKLDRHGKISSTNYYKCSLDVTSFSEALMSQRHIIFMCFHQVYL